MSTPEPDGIDLPATGPRSEWVDVDSTVSDAEIRRKDREGKVLWEQRVPVKILRRKKK